MAAALEVGIPTENQYYCNSYVMKRKTKTVKLLENIPNASMASEHKNSLIDDLNTARPSPFLEYGVFPAPLSWSS